MNESEKNLKENLKKMMIESFSQDELYTAGNYWKYYEKNILQQTDINSLSRFRSWEGGAGAGNIQSFGGGNEFKIRSSSRNFYPMDDAFSFFDESLLVQKYNSFINKIIPYIPFFKYFLIRIAEMKKYYKNIYKTNLRNKYTLIKSMDKNLVEISDSSFGIDKKNLVFIDGKIYTNAFLNSLNTIYYIKKYTKFESIKHIIELGAGIGLLASAFLKLNKKTKYLIVDIPPTIFFSQYYLKNIGYKVFGYEEIIKKETIDIKKIFESYDVICLPPWKLSKLKDFSFDLFINIHSFQEMEKKQSLNYLSVLKKKLNKYIYLQNSIEGHKKAIEKNKFGVLEPTTLKDIEECLHHKYSIVKKDIINENQTYQAIFKKN